ncbi:hypothetical protein JOQ06_021216 [Pogonophryne albipinna]|uniref:Ig-like domain-containing protein n=1 Tax=Pogonophryne albipinna TaxID=1090488 RepID=A0AAD6BSM8_9TELE|nr:hypothetical protein JOQ06_021216 [Pogonophryne albipinna]
MKVKPGQNATLQCNTSTDAAIRLLEWNRTELERYVFFFRDNKPMESYQNLRYRDRVELKDPEMKNGDASVVLKNVTVNDTGTYHCRVITNSNDPNLGEFVRSVNLSVSEGPKQPGGPGEYVGWVVGFVGVGLVVFVLVVTSKRAKEKRSLESSDEEEVFKLNP